MTPFTKEALKYLTERCNLTHLHESDEDTIKVTLKVLRKQGENIDPNEIQKWAQSNGWQPTPLKKLVKFALALSTGGRVQLKFKDMAPSEKQIKDRIIERLAENA